MKKLMLTTALASSLLVSVATAEVSIKGALEVTLGSGETPATGTKTNQGTSIGYENGLSFSGGTKLTNGMEVKVTSSFEDSGLVDQSIHFISGATDFYIGTNQNGGNLDDGQTIPVVANPIEDGNKGLGVSYNMNKATIHDQDVIGATTKTGMGSISIAYAPRVGNARNVGDSNPALTGKTGSATAIGFNGDLGVKGLGVIASYTVRDVDSLDAREINMTNIGASYNFGNVTVGAMQSTIDDSNDGAAFVAGGERKGTSAGIVYAASDAISIGYQMAKHEQKTTGKVDEDSQSITVGYNLGGATVTAQWTDVENKGGTASTDGEAFELRIKQAY
jgi:hypothetical protein